jgi:hypothetical protein
MIWMSIGPDQSQLGQATIPVVTALRSKSANLKAWQHRGHLCAASHCFVTLASLCWASILYVAVTMQSQCSESSIGPMVS